MPDAPRLARGSGRCPVCGSRKVTRGMSRLKDHAETMYEACGNPACGALWETFNVADLLDPADPRTSSFKEPCDNCAFRPGSPEQRDPGRWAEIIDSLKGDNRSLANMHFVGAGRFYCHKGVPLKAGSEHGFDYPKAAGGGYDTKRLRLCRGFLKMLRQRIHKNATTTP